MSCQVVSGIFATNLISTIDLMPLKPYFHATTSRSVAPFCCGSGLPYRPVASRVPGCIASSLRRTPVKGQFIERWRPPGTGFGSASEGNAQYLVFELGIGKHVLWGKVGDLR